MISVDLCFVSSPRDFKETMSNFTQHYKQFNKTQKQYKMKMSANVLKIMEQAEKNYRIKYTKKKQKKIVIEL